MSVILPKETIQRLATFFNAEPERGLEVAQAIGYMVGKSVGPNKSFDVRADVEAVLGADARQYYGEAAKVAKEAASDRFPPITTVSTEVIETAKLAAAKNQSLLNAL